MAKIRSFGQRTAEDLVDLVRTKKTKPQNPATVKYPTTLDTNIMAFLAQPKGDIQAATVTGGTITLGQGECWLLSRDKDTNSLKYFLDEEGEKIVRSLYNPKRTLVQGNENDIEESGNVCSLVYAVEVTNPEDDNEVEGDLYITEVLRMPCGGSSSGSSSSSESSGSGEGPCLQIGDLSMDEIPEVSSVTTDDYVLVGVGGCLKKIKWGSC
jgi:hypothetical protein